MKTKKESPRRSPSRRKDTKINNQQRIVFIAFGQRPKTMLEVSMETGVLRANICRYVSDWQKRGMIKISFFGLCPITRHRAGFYRSMERGGEKW